VLDLQKLAGNRATTRLIQREPDPKGPSARDTGDFAEALDYVNFYYDALRALIELEDKIREQALRNFKEFGELKDPPSVAGAIFAEIFKQIVGLIPGGKLVTAAVTAGVFSRELSKLEKELEWSHARIEPRQVKEARKKGPSESTKAKGEKIYGHGKSAVDAGKAVVDAGLKAAEEKAKASAAEAAAKESAVMSSKRISTWRARIELSFVQQKAIADQLKLKYKQGVDPGKLNEIVTKQLGPRPELSDALQDKLEREYELGLYRGKYAGAKWVTTTTTINGFTTTSSGIDGGPPMSKALKRRIAELDGHPSLWEHDRMIALILKLPNEERTVTKELTERGMKV
jgi:hypothetical protein